MPRRQFPATSLRQPFSFLLSFRYCCRFGHLFHASRCQCLSASAFTPASPASWVTPRLLGHIASPRSFRPSFGTFCWTRHYNTEEARILTRYSATGHLYQRCSHCAGCIMGLPYLKACKYPLATADGNKAWPHTEFYYIFRHIAFA